MTIDDVLSLEERRKLASKMLDDPLIANKIKNIVKRRIEPGYVVSFEYVDDKITGIVKSICFEIEKYDVITCAKIVRFDEWGFMPEKQTPETYRLENMKNYSILSDGRPKE